MTSDALPDASRPGPVTLRVRDLDTMRAFYAAALGMQERGTVGGTVGPTLEMGTSHETLLKLEHAPDAPPRPGFATGLYHMALLLPTRAHLARLLEHFSVFRVPLTGGADHGVSEAFYLSDPEGNGIEVYADRPREAWKWHDGLVQMTTAPPDVDGLLREAGEEAWDGMPEGARMGHVHLQVGDVTEALRFLTALGMRLTATYGEGAVFVSAGGYHHHVAANTWETPGAPAPPPGTCGLAEWTLLLPDEAALDAAEARLAPWSATREGGDVVVHDPSGARLRLSAA